MNDCEAYAHFLVNRLVFLLARFENEFFHIQPDVKINGQVKSLALSSILNEALNLHEATFPGDGNFFHKLREWGKTQDWKWNEIVIRFTWWPVCEPLQPFVFNEEKLVIKGREANNRIKHHGELATFEDTLNACSAAWFLVLEKAREAEIFIGPSEGEKIFKLFDCYDLLEVMDVYFGNAIKRPLINRVSYPSIRGKSETEEAKAAFEARLQKRQS